MKVFTFIIILMISLPAISKTLSFKRPNWVPDNEYKKILKDTKNFKKIRVVASAVDERMMSKEYRHFRDAIINAKTPEKIDSLLATAESKYDSYPNDLKFVVAQIIPFRNFRGITWRLYKLVKKQNVTHTMALSFVRRMATMMNVFFPEAHMKAAFEYVTKPFCHDQSIPENVINDPAKLDIYKVKNYCKNNKRVVQIKNANDLQKYFKVLYKSMEKSLDRIEKVDFNGKLVWDSKIFYGVTSFQDSMQRYNVLTYVDYYLTKASLHNAMANLSVMCAYNLKGTFKLAKEIGKLYGMDGYGFFNPVVGVTSYEEMKVIKTYKDLFTSTAEDRKLWIADRALSHLRRSVFNTTVAWEYIKNGSNESKMDLIDARKVLPWSDNIERSLSDMNAMLEGPVELKSNFSDKTVSFDVPKFFENAPSDLKDLLPQFTKEPNKKNRTGKTKWSYNGKKVRYTEYYWGKPQGWNTDIYSKFIKGVNSDEKIEDAIRIYSRSLGKFARGAMPTDTF